VGRALRGKPDSITVRKNRDMSRGFLFSQGRSQARPGEESRAHTPWGKVEMLVPGLAPEVHHEDLSERSRVNGRVVGAPVGRGS